MTEINNYTWYTFIYIYAREPINVSTEKEIVIVIHTILAILVLKSRTTSKQSIIIEFASTEL